MSSILPEPTAVPEPRRVAAPTGAGGADRPSGGSSAAVSSTAVTRSAGVPGAPAEAVPLAKVYPFPDRKRHGMTAQDREAGMATAEYAIATLAAVAFAALLVAVLSSGDVRELLMSLIRSALSFG